MKHKVILLSFILILVLVVSLTGCVGAVTPKTDPAISGDGITPGSTKTAGTSIRATFEPGSILDQEIPKSRSSQTLPAGLEQVQPTGSNLNIGEVPIKVLDEIIADLIRRTGTERRGIAVVRAKAVVWNDNSLGCSKNDEFDIQMPVNGYQVILQVGEVLYDYRISHSEDFILCEIYDSSIDPVPLMPIAPLGKPPKSRWTQEP